MVSKSKTTWIMVFAMLFAAAVFMVSMTATAWAADDDGTAEKKDKKTIYDEMAEDGVFQEGLVGVHKDPAVFQKNSVLSPQLKEEAIKACEDFVATHLNDNMSDLEKYYTLAVELNKHVNYDWKFWPGGYDMDYYRHQWDAYGVMIQKEAVCAGIAVTYANLCHAADLPCKFVRIKSDSLDHTISYIPDINGVSLYLDVTENIFFMSGETNNWGTIDIAFSEIKKKDEPANPSNSPFDYYQEGSLTTSGIKEFYETSFDDWFKEYALHKNTDKKFKTKYVEKGNGLRPSEAGYVHLSYSDRPRQIVYLDFDARNAKNPKDLDYNATPGLWFLDDFYADPETGSTDAIANKILNKEFDEQLLNISLKESYDCTSPEELAAAVKGDISVSYFPSAVDDKIVTKTAALTCGEDYTVTCDLFDPEARQAVLTIKATGAGGYKGEQQIPVKLFSAAVTKAPALKSLTYNGNPQELVEGGEAENGTLVYAVTQKKDQPESAEYTEAIPTATKAGKYYVWYKVIGTEGHASTEPQKTEVPPTIDLLQPKILADDITLKAGKSVKLTPELDTGQSANYAFWVEDEDIATVSEDGTVKGIAEGTTTIQITCDLTDDDPNYDVPKDKVITVNVTTKNFIEQARVLPGEYDKSSSGELTPEVTYFGETLKEGTDYTWEKVDPSQTFDQTGDYEIKLIGKGNFLGETTKTFRIILPEDEATQAVEKAKADLAAAQAAILDGTLGTTEALKALVTAQQALSQAQDALDRTKDVLSEVKQEQLQDQIAQLEEQIEDLNDQLAEVSVIDISKYAVTMKTSVPYTGKAIKPAVKISGLNESCYTVSYSNNKKIGTAKVTIKAKGDHYKGTIKKTFKITKGINPLKVKAKTATVKYNTLKKKNQTLKVAKVIKVTKKGQGKLSYAKASGSKKITIDKKSGKVTVKKGLKKGTYKVKVKVKAAGNANYKAAAKTVTFKIKVN